MKKKKIVIDSVFSFISFTNGNKVKFRSGSLSNIIYEISNMVFGSAYNRSGFVALLVPDYQLYAWRGSGSKRFGRSIATIRREHSPSLFPLLLGFLPPLFPLPLGFLLPLFPLPSSMTRVTV